MFDVYWQGTALALFIGCVLQTALGFGMAIVAAPIIMLFAPQYVPSVITIVALFLSVQNATNLRSDIQWKFMLPAYITRVPGTVIGVALVALMPTFILQLIITLMVFVAIFVTIFIKPFNSTVLNMSVASFFSGIAGSATSIGGPPMAIVMQHGKSNHTRANLSGYFVFACFTSLVGYQLAGLMDSHLWITGLTLTPIAFIAFYIGKKLRIYTEKYFRQLLLIVCIFSASIAMLGVVQHFIQFTE
ncbi:sulfite exporter TauE/SafE family protein [Marinicellulosiphila megalodicopiae]|uniref:sulfite exporter TauE/SafE family protein n=1 Tax=Marinicellulosiphila megalodicopiae TaxID=2724896 RepID=UPI003BAEA734